MQPSTTGGDFGDLSHATTAAATSTATAGVGGGDNRQRPAAARQAGDFAGGPQQQQPNAKSNYMLDYGEEENWQSMVSNYIYISYVNDKLKTRVFRSRFVSHR